jgi:hypothetical protein
MSDYLLYPLNRGETVTGHEWVPLRHHDFLASAFVAHACAAGRRADVGTAMILWMEAMRQNPAGTLPVGDVELAALAKFGPDLAGWQAAREGALYGWKPCHVLDDQEDRHDRLAHPVVTEIAVEMCRRKRGREAGREAGRMAQQRSRIRKCLDIMPGINPAWKGDAVVDDLRRWIDETGLFISADNLRVGLREVIRVNADFGGRARL